MKFMRTLCLISLGGLAEANWAASTGGSHELQSQLPLWLGAFVISALGWSWAAVGAGMKRLSLTCQRLITGRTLPLPTTDPKALAAEVSALNAQISQLRDTATSFDLSFDQTLQRLDERLRRLEQQSAFVQVGRTQ